MQLFDALYRNGSWRLLLCFVLLALCELKEVQLLSAQTLDDPPDPPPEWIDLDYPASIHILGIQFDKDTRRTKAHGSDIWPITWAADDNQYSAFGDGGGFGGTNTDGRVSMGVARIQGKLTDYSGVNVWGGKHSEHRSQFKGKGTGIISVDGALYMWVARPKKITAETGLAVSHDYARTWQLADWHWTMKDRICAGAFLNAGRDNAEAPDEYVYAYFTRIETSKVSARPWIYERPGRIDLARAPHDQVLDQSVWQWYAGTDDQAQPKWTSAIEDRRPVFEDPNGIKVVSASFQPALRRYLLSYSPRDNSGNFALFEAEHPWGPWNEIAYLKQEPLFMPPAPNRRISTFHFAPKWWNEDGTEFGMVFVVGDDAWNTVQGHLLLKAKKLGGTKNPGDSQPSSREKVFH